MSAKFTLPVKRDLLLFYPAFPFKKEKLKWMGPTLFISLQRGSWGCSHNSGMRTTSQVSGQHGVFPCCMPRKVNFSCPLSSSISDKNPLLLGPGNSWSALLFRGSFSIVKIILSRQGKHDSLSHFPQKKMYQSASAFLSSSLTLNICSLVLFVILPCVGVPTFGDFQIWLSWPESYPALCPLSWVPRSPSHFPQQAPQIPCSEFHHSATGLLGLLRINIC